MASSGVWHSRKLNTHGPRPTSRCRAAMSACPTPTCSPPSCLSPSMGAKGAGDRHDLAPGTLYYTRMNRWSKTDVLDRVFEHLQREQVVRIKLEALSRDHPLVKVHPDGTGARKKRPPTASAGPEAAGPPRGIGVPRMIERLSSSRPRPGTPPPPRRAAVTESPWPAPRESRADPGPGVRGRQDSATGRGAGGGAVVPPRRRSGGALGVCP